MVVGIEWNGGRGEGGAGYWLGRKKSGQACGKDCFRLSVDCRGSGMNTARANTLKRRTWGCRYVSMGVAPTG